MNTTLVIHHSADFDGLCSREIARKALGNTADYLGWDYGQPLPNLAAYQTIYLIDISLPPGVMALHADKLIWIDHHKSAIEAMKGVEIRGNRIDGVAACRLAWQWFFHPEDDSSASKEQFVRCEVQEPEAVKLLGLYDVWQKDRPEVDLFQLGLQAESAPLWDRLLWTPGPAQPKEANDQWAELQQGYIEQIIRDGRAIQAYVTVTSAEISVQRGFDVVFEGLTFRALCTARCNSMTFLAALQPKHDGCLAYHWNGSKWRFSLYHAPGKEQHDLSKIASKFGGGGHRGACGFELGFLPPELGGEPDRGEHG